MAAQIRPVKYELVVADSADELSTGVNRLISLGWVPHGDTKTTSTTCGVLHAQAMIKLEIVDVGAPIQPVRGSNIIVPQM